MDIAYGYLDVQDKVLYTMADSLSRNLARGGYRERPKSNFTMQDYLDKLFEGQNVTVVENAEDADIILTVEKATEDNGISLIDSNFFMESPILKDDAPHAGKEKVADVRVDDSYRKYMANIAANQEVENSSFDRDLEM